MPDLFRNCLRILILPVLFYSCTGSHLISDKEYRDKVDSKFRERKSLASRRSQELFSVFEGNLSSKQGEALKFLYAFMPLSDLADYSGDFFLSNAKLALKAVDEVTWGKEIPEDIFLHYVLPCRVNNENLDSFRIVCYDEIHRLISGKTMKDAALEINYWCQQKVNYQPADIRTSSPLKTMLSARGRCGEESTLTVAALRTAGIPARQVYTPRWAHVDDNHAWVEIWIDGEWHYIGACEPEPILDRGWFTEPARRAMLVHTKSFGAAYGHENAINTYPNYTEVNCLSRYAVTKRIYVKVLGNDRSPVSGASVDYCLYNYAEFYPLTSVTSDTRGISSFETGLGDLLIRAGKDDAFAWKKVSVAAEDTLILNLRPGTPRDTSIDLDLNIPPVLPPHQGPPEELIRKNSERIRLANSIRLDYIDSWIKPGEIADIALKKNIDTTTAKDIFSRAMGNYGEIRKFLLSVPDSVVRYATDMLKVLPDKDLRDAEGSVLYDHLMSCLGKVKRIEDRELFLKYVLNPRIANEMLVSWRGFLLKSIPGYLIENVPGDLSIIRKWMIDSILIADDENYYRTPLTPSGAFRLRVSDSGSRDILFVAICRSLGIPARLGPGQNIPQYFSDDRWNDVSFVDQESRNKQPGYLKVTAADGDPVPEYSNHFTISGFDSGRYSVLDYEFARKATGFDEELKLPEGSYMITTGNRLVDGRILANISFLTLAAGEHRIVEIKLRKDSLSMKPFGKFELAGISQLFPGKTFDVSRGIMLFWTEQGQEPSRHIFTDLAAVKKEIDEWDGPVVFLETSAASVSASDNRSDLPSNSFFTKDPELQAFRSCVKLFKPIPSTLPIAMYVNPEGYILFFSSGYTIGIGHHLLKCIK